MYLLKCFGDTFASFIGYYEVAQETGARVVPSKQSHNAIESNLKMADSNPTACLHLSQLSIWATMQSPYLFSFINITRRN